MIDRVRIVERAPETIQVLVIWADVRSLRFAGAHAAAGRSALHHIAAAISRRRRAVAAALTARVSSSRLPENTTP